jgi:general secretion pathway protein F
VHVAPTALARLLVQMAQTLESGLTLRALAGTRALETVPRRAALRLRADILADVPLSQSLAGQGLLDRGPLAILRAAEVRGELPRALRSVADGLIHRAKLRNGLLMVVAYPVLLLLVAAALRPLPIAFTEGQGAYLVRVVPAVLAVAGLSAFFLFVLPRMSRFPRIARSLRVVSQGLPVIRTATASGALAAFAGVLGSCVRAGLPVREALQLAAGSAGHPAFDEGAARLTGRLDEGASLAEALTAVPAIPSDFVAEVSSGELSGHLDEALSALAVHHERKARLLWTLVAAAAGSLVFAAVLASLALDVVNAWTHIFREQGLEIDRLSR